MKLVFLCIWVVYLLATVTAIYEDGYYYVYYDDEDLRNDLQDGYLSPPENMVVDAENTSTTLFVYWDPPANGSEFVKYYQVNWNGHPDVHGSITGPDTSCVIQDLYPCNSYKVTVTASTTNHGDSSSEDYGYTGDDVPAMPDNLQCLVLNSTAIYVTWVRPAFSCPITSYLLTGNGNSLWNNQSDEIYDDDILISKRYDHLTNLIPYAVYDLSVYAVNDFGLSASATCTPTTNQAAPGPPTDVEAVEASISSLYVTWLPPDERNGILIRYWVRVWVDSELLTEVDTIGNDTYIVIDNLEQCITYDITILAETGGGNGTESIPGSGFIQGTPEYANPTCFQTSSDTIFVAWNVTNPLCDNGEVITNVTWEIVIFWMEGSDVISDVAQTFNDSYDINEFYYYSNYNITISDASGANGVFCVTETSQGAPSEPANLKCALNDATSITLQWDPPVEINGVIDHYTVRMSGSEDNVHVDTTSYKFTGLTPSTSYDFSVTASTNDGNESYEGPAANITASTTEVITTTTTSVVTEVFTKPVTYSPFSSTTLHPPPSSHVGAIVGGVIGGILLLCICIALGMYIRKHSKSQTKF